MHPCIPFRTFFVVSAVLACTVLSDSATAAEPSPEKPLNFVFLLADDLGWADLACFPETHGFDANIGGSHWGAPTTFFYPYSGSGTFGNEFRYVPHLELGSKDEYLTDRLTSEAIRIVEQVHDRPFFLNMWWHTVHTPIEAPQAMVEPYEQKLRPELNHQNARYAAMVESLDTNVG